MEKKVKEIFTDYYEKLEKAWKSEQIRTAISRAIESYRKNLAYALTRYPHTPEMAKEVRKIKEKSIRKWKELLKEAMENIKENKGNSYFAKTANDARKIIEDIVGTKKLIVKSKSITGEEVEIREYLERIGNEVWETDLGELIIQLLKLKPMHILSPAVGIPREEVAKIFSQIMKREILPEIQEEVKTAREFLREKYFHADIGISGANVVAADTGAIFIIENEGNAKLVTGLPPVHIVLVGIEKIVPTTQDAFKVAEVTWRYAQYTVPSSINVIGGLTKTGDIEKVITYGAQGPKELHVVFLDNGRSELAKHDIFKEVLYCLRCGGCMFECPIFALTAGYFGHKYFIGYGSVWDAFVSGFKFAAPSAFTCVRCGRCKEICPMKIDTPKLIVELRKELITKVNP